MDAFKNLYTNVQQKPAQPTTAPVTTAPIGMPQQQPQIPQQQAFQTNPFGQGMANPMMMGGGNFMGMPQQQMMMNQQQFMQQQQQPMPNNFMTGYGTGMKQPMGYPQQQQFPGMQAPNPMAFGTNNQAFNFNTNTSMMQQQPMNPMMMQQQQQRPGSFATNTNNGGEFKFW
ncbi:hypothetical protein FGO68_gene5114 [Halteria grandinella]|uniref:Uncharacterized protein n=1 Tax=Halteria grandinella TaxID=5974 RepID=A0A8J8T5K8_HALGN|nr:hypothetical protein FGO68_gene5114 [Halteria grandinella]